MSANLYILSPHRDDAAYGLTLSISRFINNKLPVAIINCFTVTRWTIVFVSKDVKEVTLIREKEDIAFNTAFHSAIDMINLNLLDAPLRNGYIFQYKPFEPDEWDIVNELKNHLERIVDGILLCPLAIGNHIDHAICREAVVQLYKKWNVLFYEDMPYTYRITEDERRLHIKALEERLQVPLFDFINGWQHCTINKEQAIRVYKSQLNDEICAEIIAHMNELAGERLWGEAKVIERLKNELSC